MTTGLADSAAELSGRAQIDWVGRAGRQAQALAADIRRTAVLLDAVVGELGEWKGPLRSTVEQSIRTTAGSLSGIGSTLSWRATLVMAAAAARRAAAPGAGSSVAGGSWVR